MKTRKTSWGMNSNKISAYFRPFNLFQRLRDTPKTWKIIWVSILRTFIYYVTKISKRRPTEDYCWGSEIWTTYVNGQKVVGLQMVWILNGIWNPDAQPFEIRTNGCIFSVCNPDFEWSRFQMVGSIALLSSIRCFLGISARRITPYPRYMATQCNRRRLQG